MLAAEAARANDIPTMYRHADREASLIVANQACFAEFAVDDALDYLQER